MRSKPRVEVVPVLIDEAEPPDASELPLALEALPGRQVERLRLGQADADIERLIGRLVELRDKGQEADRD